MTEPEHEFMTASEVAALFRLTPQGVTKLARAGKIPGFQLGREWRFNRAEILAMGRVVKGGSADGGRAA